MAETKDDCKDCICCKTETSSDEHYYCEYYNDYFLKNDSKHTCNHYIKNS